MALYACKDLIGHDGCRIALPIALSFAITFGIPTAPTSSSHPGFQFWSRLRLSRCQPQNPLTNGSCCAQAQ